MDTSLYIKKFKIALLIVVVALVLCILMLVKTIPSIQNLIALNTSYTNQTSVLNESRRKLEVLKNNAELEKNNSEEKNLKAFFRPIGTGLDSEDAIAEEFNEILQLMRDNRVKARSIKSDPDPEDDKFVKNAHDKYYVSKVTADLVANYSNFEGFLRDLFKHEHFLEISKMEIIPYEKDKKILLINLEIKLYAQKS